MDFKWAERECELMTFIKNFKTFGYPIPENILLKEKIIKQENEVRILTHRLKHIDSYGDDNLEMSYENQREDLYHCIAEDKAKLLKKESVL